MTSPGLASVPLLLVLLPGLARGQADASITALEASVTPVFVQAPDLAENPSGFVPLSASLTFETDVPVRAIVRIQDEDRAWDVSHEEFVTRHRFDLLGVRAEKVAAEAVRGTRAYQAGTHPVGEYLADQLLVPMALLAGGEFVTNRPSSHLTTNVETCRQLLGDRIRIEEQGNGNWRVEVRAPQLPPAGP